MKLYMTLRNDITGTAVPGFVRIVVPRVPDKNDVIDDFPLDTEMRTYTRWIVSRVVWTFTEIGQHATCYLVPALQS